MKKILFLILGCIFAQSSVNAMENPLQLIFSTHVIKRMAERGITISQVESVIRSGETFSDVSGEIIYKKQIGGRMFYSAVVINREVSPNKIIIKTAYLEGQGQIERKSRERIMREIIRDLQIRGYEINESIRLREETMDNGRKNEGRKNKERTKFEMWD